MKTAIRVISDMVFVYVGVQADSTTCLDGTAFKQVLSKDFFEFSALLTHIGKEHLSQNRLNLGNAI